MTKSIPRMKLAEVDEALRDERTQLAKDSMEQLGYKKLAQAILMPGTLLFKLRELEIEPLSTDAVERYKRKMAKPGMWSDTKLGLWLFGLALFFACGVAPYINENLDWTAAHLGNFGVIAACILAGILTAIGFGQTFDFSHTHAHRITRKWHRSLIREYPGNVPEFALRKALPLRSHGATICVDYLEESTESGPIRLPDPFLVATLGDENYYIDVWDEKEYK